jgi:iron complex outermembrane recepter protein
MKTSHACQTAASIAFLFLLPLLAASTGFGQATAPAAPATPPVDAGVVELSPFTVNAAADKGYRAENTLAGSRLNSSLRDTPSSISVFTEKFLLDLGINQIEDFVGYTVGSTLAVQDTNAAPNANAAINGQSLVRGIDIRGIGSSLGLDYFKSITPNDGYRIGRYDESRGPNGILFGISSAGGLINQSSILATTNRDSGKVSYAFGGGAVSANRWEFHANKVVVPKKLALAISAVDQQNSGWRKPDYQDKRRLFGTLTFTPNDRVTLRVSGERGNEFGSRVAPYPLFDGALAWLDNRNAKGVAAVTFVPNNAATATAAQLLVGVVARNQGLTTAIPGIRRFVSIENDGTLFNSTGTLLTGSYENPAVRSPNGQPGVSGVTLAINDPSYVPQNLNSGGPGMDRSQNLHNSTVSLDWRITPRLTFNFSQNDQHTDLESPVITGASPMLSGDANTLQGVGGPANPYVGRLYIDATWINGDHRAHYRESRASLAYQLEPTWKWLGTHRLASMFSRSKDVDSYNSRQWGFLGAPFNAAADNQSNRISQRIYLDEKNPASFQAPDWRKLPKTAKVGTTTYDAGWINGAAGTNNSYATQESDARLAVVQSHFFNRRLVATFGYRVDSADITSYAFGTDPVLKSSVVDYDVSKATVNSVKGITRTQGAVVHATSWASLIANWSTNIGIPTFTNKVLPSGLIPDPSKGQGSDYGISLDLLENRLSMKAVYFQTDSTGNTGSGGIDARYNQRNIRIADALQAPLVGPGLPYTAAQWAPIRSAITIPVSAQMFDQTTNGYEFSAVANPTRNWRVTATYSYTDRIRKNSAAADAIPWYGYTFEGKLLKEGVKQNADASYTITPMAFTTTGTVAKWLELAAKSPATDLTKLVTASSITAAQEILNMTRDINDDIQQNEQRWGLRPHKVSFFTAYDFTTGRLQGLTAGAGYRWRSPNVIGRYANGSEIEGRALTGVDLMTRYSHKISQSRFRGTLSYQLNVSNALDQHGIVPQRFSSTPDFIIPGGRGIAYSRIDFVDPRSIRFTTTFSY